MPISLYPNDASPSASAWLSYQGANTLPDACLKAPEAKKSSDVSVPRVTWWHHRGTKEWVERRWKSPAKVSSAAVYWFDDTGFAHAGFRHRGAFYGRPAWKPVEAAGEYGVERD